MSFETFDLGRIMQTAEAIKGMKRQGESDKLRDAYLNTQMQGAQQQQKFAAQDQTAEMDARTARQHYLAAQAVETAADPRAAAREFAPEMVAALEKTHGPGSFDQLPPEVIKQIAAMGKQKSAAAAGINLQPSPDVMAQQQFALQRDQQNFGQQKQLAGMQQGQQREMAGVQHQYRLDEIHQQGANALMIAAQKANKNTTVDAAGIQKTWATYQQARKGLVEGLASTPTNYAAGKLPALTTGQQVAEGSVAAMAPVLKQIFRVAGEGTFTDKDQELLLNMVPTRSDNESARKAKLKNIDNIIRAKLGMPEDTAPGADLVYIPGKGFQAPQ